jgi:hypothetical protein
VRQTNSRRRITRLSTMAVVGVALIAGGCSSASASGPTQAAYNAQANAICRTYNAKLTAFGSELSNASSAQQAASELNAAVALAEQGSAKLKALPKPSGQSSALDQVYAAQEAQVTQLQALATALSQNDTAKVQSIDKALNASNGPLNRQFDAVGLRACGSGSSS